VQRAIDGFHQDEVGDWVAELRCGHGQHVRHHPPFWVRPWVLTGASSNSIAVPPSRADRERVPETNTIRRVAEE